MAKKITEEVKPIFASLGSAAEVPGKGIAGLLDMLRTVLESKPVKDVTDGIPPNVIPAGAMAKGGAAGAEWLGKLLAAGPGLAAGMVNVKTPELLVTTDRLLKLLPRVLAESLQSSPQRFSVVADTKLPWYGAWNEANKLAKINTSKLNIPEIAATIGHETVGHGLASRAAYMDKTISPLLGEIADEPSLGNVVQQLIKRGGYNESDIPQEVYARLLDSVVLDQFNLPSMAEKALKDPRVVRMFRDANKKIGTATTGFADPQRTVEMAGKVGRELTDAPLQSVWQTIEPIMLREVEQASTKDLPSIAEQLNWLSRLESHKPSIPIRYILND